MPPKAVAPAPAVIWAPAAGRLPPGIRTGARNEVQIRNQNAPAAGGPRVTIIRNSDIFTHNAQCIVIGTDENMNRRKEFPFAKFHTLAGPNLKRWNDLCHYTEVPNPAPPPLTITISDLQAVSSAVRSPSFRTTSNNWIVMSHVPDFVNGPLDGQGWRGNSLQLYNCYINAFIAAMDPVLTTLPAAVVASIPPNMPGVAPGTGLGGAALPTTISFSFMGPSNGWDVKEAALIAVTAIRDATQGLPLLAYIVGSPLTQGIVNQVVAWFTQITICASHSPASTTRAQARALKQAWDYVMRGPPFSRPNIPPPPVVVPPAVPPPPVFAPPANPLTKVTRSNRPY